MLRRNLPKPRSSSISMAFSWSAGRTCWSFLGLEPSCIATLGMTPGYGHQGIYQLFATVSGLKDIAS